MTELYIWIAQHLLASLLTLPVLAMQYWAYRRTRHWSLLLLVWSSIVSFFSSMFSLLGLIGALETASTFAAGFTWFAACGLAIFGTFGLLRWVVRLAGRPDVEECA